MATLPASSTSSAPIDERVFCAQVGMLYAICRTSGPYPTFILPLAYASFNYWLSGNAHIWWWLALRAVSWAVYIPLLIRRKPATLPEYQRWLNLYLQALLSHGLTWGLAPWLFMPMQDFPLVLATTAVLIMMCGAGLNVVTPRWSTVLAFLLPPLLSLAAALLWHGHDMREYFLAFCTLLALVLGLSSGRDHCRLLADSIRIRFENEALNKQLAEQVRAVQLANEEKNRFLAAASHDLRQPVHAIGMFGAVLENGLHDHPLHDNAQQLLRAVNMLGQSLDTMLDVSRLDAGLVTPTITATPLNPLFQTLNHIFIGKADEKALQLRIRATPLWAQTDAQLLQRMLGNLIENALKYTTRGGVIVRARARGAHVWIDVVDTGIGIAPELQEQVFAEFYQIGNPGRDRSRGLGIGLSIVRRLSGLLDHPVWLHSRPGRGSRFRVVLPAAPAGLLAAQGQGPPSVTMPRPGAQPITHVLLVEDEDSIAHAMAELLRTHGITLTHAATPQQAEQLVTQSRANGPPFDIAICDLRLADGADGLALALKLSDPAGSALPTLLITGETAPEPLNRVRAAGLPVLFKPITAHVLLEALARVRG
ncbi:hybrid sensor histidine kinase/response regulator [Azonexus sp.]|jgi:signal transduction histidine kinase/CheY-like chemotaxis protein|uniref:ATP-binding response regulator n=1 Tax=Azonexus sp. TaxID=1872668 RepID=UPI00281C84AB|nr:hybrid sensor histidine kinase/response regulator [Azonexus sp.]MDR1994309.1 hybrid sensor histidine kinase/response regulator [Azonexus sp.]